MVHVNKKEETLPVIIDFGACSSVTYQEDGSVILQTINWEESRPYHPPEINLEDAQRYGVDLIKYDVWSCGILFYELIVGDLPFTRRDDDDYIHFLESYENGTFLEEFEFDEETEILKILLISMLNPDPNNRPNTTQLLRMFPNDI